MAETDPTQSKMAAEMNDEDDDLTNEMNKEFTANEDPMTDSNNEKKAESRIPAKKDATLREFLGKMDDYAPIVSDAAI